MPDLSASHQPWPFLSLESEEVDFIHGLWDDLAEFPVRDIEGAVDHLMTALSGLANAQNAVWVGAVRMADCDVEVAVEANPLQGWRVARTKMLHAGPVVNDQVKELTRKWDRRELDPSFLKAVAGAGAFRVHSFRRDLPADWFQTPFYQTAWAAIGVYDVAFVGFPVNRDAESHFGFHRKTPQAPFSEVEIARLAYALRGIKWFHQRMMLSYGLTLASSPLSPAERGVLRLLSTDSTEKEIALDLGLSATTLHQYVKSIFRKFGVRSRAGLMSLWLGARA